MSTFPTSYVCYRFDAANGPFVRAEITWKEPKLNEVTIKVLASGVCGSDTIVHSGFLGNPMPCIPGHEVVGDIVAVHPTVTHWTVGQRVGVPWVGGHCGQCNACRSGVFTACEKGFAYTTGGWMDGGYAQYITVSIDALASVPGDSDPAEVAPMMCAGVTVHKSILHLNTPPGALVAVQGIGGLGHLAIQFYRAMGYRVVAISTSSAKKDLAVSLGAQYYIDQSQQDTVEELKKLGGADVIVSTIPAAQAAIDLADGLAYEGKLLILGLSTETATFMPASLTARRFSIHGFLCGTAKDCEDTMAFARLHNIKCMVERFPLERAAEAYKHRYSARFRAVIVP